jgi:arginase
MGRYGSIFLSRRQQAGLRIGNALEDVDDNTHLHVSFDVDCLDPEIAPGVGTTVAGGMSYREAQWCMEMIADTGRVASLDITELNPALDVRNKTALLAVDLVESLFGKSRLVREHGLFHPASLRRGAGRSMLGLEGVGN